MSIRNLMMSCVVACAVLAGAPAVASAQARPVQGGDDRTMLVGAGVTFLNVAESTGFGVAGNVLFNTLSTTGNGRIGIVGDVGFNHFDGGTISTIMGGARYTFTTTGKVVPYGQFLVGIVHAPGNSDFDPSIGFGVDVAWRPNLNFRGEISFILADANATRFFFGVSLPLNKKK